MLINNVNESSFSKNWLWYLILGSLLTICGILAISASVMTTLFTVVFIGFLLAFFGLVSLIDTFQRWWRQWGIFLPHFVFALLYLVLGIMFVKNPVMASASLTLFLAFLFIAFGIYRIIFALSVKFASWGWILFNGIITLILGILILAGWPGTSLFIIGLFVGIDLVFGGLSLMMAALVSHSIRA